MRRPVPRRAAGFTLIELLVSVAILGIIVLYLLRSFTVQHRTYTVVDETTELQQNARAVADLLERDLRHAGLMVPESGAVCGVDSTSAPDMLFVSDAEAILPGAEKAADFGADLTVATTVAGSASETLVLDGLVAEPLPVRPAYDTDNDGVADSDFREGAGVIVTDLAEPDRGAACGVVTDIPSATQITVAWRSGALESAGTDLVAIPAHAYLVNVDGALERDGDVLVENVDDFQVAYFFDGDLDAQVDANEYRGVSGVGYDPSDSAIEENEIREVRANLVLRTRFEDPNWPQGVFQNLENRAAVAGTDGFRRRVHTATVRLRNVGNR
jgi:prepilin-type N-terminal cleavage/methylation domain-containing protein